MPETWIEEWIGVDLDRTLAYYDELVDEYTIGEPIPEMVYRVVDWLVQGKRVKIFTARVSTEGRGADWSLDQVIYAIQDWTEKHIGQRLEVTCIKDRGCREIWDDRAIGVIPNTGIRTDGEE
jgi:hypothetical protein